MSFKVKQTNKTETAQHFIIKCIVWKILLENSHKAKLEYDSGVGVFDVFDTTLGIVYEIEPTLRRYKSKWNQYKDCDSVKDLHVLPYNKILKDVGVDSKLLKKLKKEIEKYIQV